MIHLLCFYSLSNRNTIMVPLFPQPPPPPKYLSYTHLRLSDPPLTSQMVLWTTSLPSEQSPRRTILASMWIAASVASSYPSSRRPGSRQNCSISESKVSQRSLATPTRCVDSLLFLPHAVTYRYWQYGFAPKVNRPRYAPPVYNGD